jgi:hypothetical protein
VGESLQVVESETEEDVAKSEVEVVTGVAVVVVVVVAVVVVVRREESAH